MPDVGRCTLGAEGDTVGAAEPVHGQFVQWTDGEGTAQEGYELVLPQEDSCTVSLGERDQLTQTIQISM